MGLQAAITLNRAYDEGGMKGLATSAGSLGISAYVQTVSAGMMDVNFSYTRDGGFGGGLSFGNNTTFHAGVGYTTKSKDWNANAGYGKTTVGVSKTKQGGWGGSFQAGAYEVSYSEKNGFGAAISVPMGKDGKYGSMRFGMQFDDHMGWKGANVNYTTPASGDKYFSGTQSFGFGYNKDSGYSLSTGTTVNTAAGLGTNTTNTFMFDKGGTFSGATLDTSMRYSYDNYKDMREKSEQVDREMTETERSDAQRKSEDLSLWDRLDLAASGMWESMKGSLSGGWEGVMASLTGAWDDITKLPERITQLMVSGQFKTGQEQAVAAAIEYYENNTVNIAHATDEDLIIAGVMAALKEKQHDEELQKAGLAAAYGKYYEEKVAGGEFISAQETVSYYNTREFLGYKLTALDEMNRDYASMGGNGILDYAGLLGCNTNKGENLTTEGAKLGGIFGEKYDSLSDNNKLAVTMKYIQLMSKEVNDEFVRQGYSVEDARGMALLKMANTLYENVPISYINGSVFDYQNQKVTQNWDGSKFVPHDTPAMDCSGFVGAVLYAMGYGADLQNPGPGPNGPANILSRNDLFGDVTPNSVKMGDIAYTGNYNHILIVAEIQNGKASKYIHSSPYDYNDPKTPYVPGLGLQISPFPNSTNLRFKRLKVGAR